MSLLFVFSSKWQAGGWTTHQKYELNWIISPIFGMNIKNIWNHHLVLFGHLAKDTVTHQPHRTSVMARVWPSNWVSIVFLSNPPQKKEEPTHHCFHGRRKKKTEQKPVKHSCPIFWLSNAKKQLTKKYNMYTAKAGHRVRVLLQVPLNHTPSPAPW